MRGRLRCQAWKASGMQNQFPATLRAHVAHTSLILDPFIALPSVFSVFQRAWNVTRGLFFFCTNIYHPELYLEPWKPISTAPQTTTRRVVEKLEIFRRFYLIWHTQKKNNITNKCLIPVGGLRHHQLLLHESREQTIIVIQGQNLIYFWNKPNRLKLSK